MKHLAIALAIPLCMSTLLLANGNAVIDLKGLVTDTLGNPLSRAWVNMLNGSLIDTTDPFGSFRLASPYSSAIHGKTEGRDAMESSRSFLANGTVLSVESRRRSQSRHLPIGLQARDVATSTRSSVRLAARAAEPLDTLMVHRQGFLTLRHPIASLTDSLVLAMTPDPSRGWNLNSLPGTGLTGDFTATFGEDGDHPGLVSTRLLTGGMVLDLVTGLLWQQGESPSLNRSQAVTYCDTLTLGGLRWRLPDAQEAFSILNLGFSNPAVDPTRFTAGPAQYWWTSTPSVAAGKVWVTNAGGGIGAHDTSESQASGGTRWIAARCVHSDVPARSLHAFTVLTDSVVRDENTGLEWSRYAMSRTVWDSALALAEGSAISGLGGWRLPDIRELRSIVDERLLSPALDTVVFPDAGRLSETGTHPGEITRLYWSSTVLVNHPENAWMADMTSGLTSYGLRNTAHMLVRPVRGGKP